MMDYRVGATTGIPAFIGAFIGANLVLQISESALRVIIILISLLVLPFLLFSPRIGTERTKNLLTHWDYVIGISMSFAVGVYGGFYGVLSATFFSYILILWFGLTFLENAATMKIGSLAMTSISAFVFAYHGSVDYPMAISTFFGCCTGTLIGVQFAGRSETPGSNDFFSSSSWSCSSNWSSGNNLQEVYGKVQGHCTGKGQPVPPCEGRGPDRHRGTMVNLKETDSLCAVALGAIQYSLYAMGKARDPKDFGRQDVYTLQCPDPETRVLFEITRELLEP